MLKWLQLAEQHVYKQNVHKTFLEGRVRFEEVHAQRCHPLLRLLRALL